MLLFDLNVDYQFVRSIVIFVSDLGCVFEESAIASLYLYRALDVRQGYRMAQELLIEALSEYSLNLLRPTTFELSKYFH